MIAVHSAAGGPAREDYEDGGTVHSRIRRADRAVFVDRPFHQSRLPEPIDWHRDALCTTEEHRHEFEAFLDSRLYDNRNSRYSRYSRRVCRDCPVRDACLDEALELGSPGHEIPGLWGGTTPKERTRIRMRRELTTELGEHHAVA